MKEIFLLKYGEMTLKGANRSVFEKTLLNNIRRKLAPLGSFFIERAQSTVTVIPKSDDTDMEEVFDCLKTVFGIAALSRSAAVDKDMDSIAAAVDYLKHELSNVSSFKIVAKRSDKSFPYNSPEICTAIGAHVLLGHPHLRVDVHNPELIVMVEVRDRFAFVHAGQSMGAGGMPVGTAGKAALLISGGIDSPVAGYMMAKRGLEIMAIHFLSPPYTGPRARLKVMELCRTISRYTGPIQLAMIHFTEIQETIAKSCPEEYFTLVMRRFMMEISSRLARKKGCRALITGESLGQVASQTVSAIACTDIASKLVVLRPLIGLDKEEIVGIARKIGTFDTSILPFEDCCTVFTPRHPKTFPHLNLVLNAEAALDRDTLIANALSSVEFIRIDEQFEF